MVFRLSEIEMIFLKWWKNTTYQRSYMLFHQQPERIEKKYLIYARIQTVMFLLYRGIYQMVDGRVSVSSLRPVSIEDLLGRDQVVVDNDGIHSFFAG